MATRGQRPKPAYLKLVQGNPGKRKDTTATEPKPDRAPPPMPPFLDATGKKEWTRVVIMLQKMGVLGSCDYATLGAYCDAYSLLIRANRALRSRTRGGGYIVKTPNGHHQASGWMSIRNKAIDQVYRFGTEFGLTPVSRARLGQLGDPRTPGGGEWQDE